MKRFLSVATLASASLLHAQTMQQPADVRAYTKARSTADPEQKLAALRQFLHDYPKSNRASAAQNLILNTLVKSFPQRTDEIDRQVAVELKDAGKGIPKSEQESYLAETLATHDADLKRARQLAEDGEKHMNEQDYDAATLADYKKYKVPPPQPDALHKQYNSTREGSVEALGAVALHQHNDAEAQTLFDRAYALDPSSDTLNQLRGELALRQNKPAEALHDFERAQLLGVLDVPDRDRMMQLYAAAHNGSGSNFVAEMDAMYRDLYPASWEPAKATPSTSGHTVLLELFTGSACGPCVGGDLMVEGILAAYPRSEVVALAFDQHIPEPDPLANADSVAEAKQYGVLHTPNYVLDGAPLDVYGGGRSRAAALYADVQKPLDTEAARPSPVRLTLHAKLAADNTVQATADVQTGTEAQLRAEEWQPVVPSKPVARATAGDAKPAIQPVLHMALVEDDVRYSGENGMRFHRMVVRSLANGAPVEVGATRTLQSSFNLQSVSATLSTYLTDYAKNNERFGPITFLSTDTTIDPQHLAVAAWLEDATTHRVLQAAFTPVAALPQPSSGGSQ